MTSAEKFLIEMGNVDDEFIEEAMNYTMKKKFNFKPIIAVAACAAFALAAVPVAHHFANINIDHTSGTTATTTPVLGASGKFTVLYAGSGDGDSALNVNTPIEIGLDKNGKSFRDREKVGTTATIEVEGKTYVGTYYGSDASAFYKDDKDLYMINGDYKSGSFEISRETGEVTDFFITGFLTGGDMTQEEAYNIVNVFLQPYLNGKGNYEMTYEHDSGTAYLFIFSQMVNGMQSSDYAAVSISKNGEIFSFSSGSLGALQNADASHVDMNKMYSALEEKVNEMYKNYYYAQYRSCEKATLTKLADGSYVVDCYVLVGVIYEEESFAHDDLIRLIVQIDK